MTELEQLKEEIKLMKQQVDRLQNEVKRLKKLRMQDQRVSQLQIRRTRPLGNNISYNRG